MIVGWHVQGMISSWLLHASRDPLTCGSERVQDDCVSQAWLCSGTCNRSGLISGLANPRAAQRWPQALAARTCSLLGEPLPGSSWLCLRFPWPGVGSGMHQPPLIVPLAARALAFSACVCNDQGTLRSRISKTRTSFSSPRKRGGGSKNGFAVWHAWEHGGTTTGSQALALSYSASSTVG